MPNVSRKGDMIVTGHGCEVMAPIDWAPCGGSETVFANTIGVSHRGACIQCHLWPVVDDCVLHCPVVNRGSPNVFVEGIPLARVFDSADRGYIIEGSPNVFANEARDGSAPTEGDDDGETGDDPGSGSGSGSRGSISTEYVISIIGPDDSGIDYGARWNPHNPDHVAQLANGAKENDLYMHELGGGVRPIKTDAEYVEEGRLGVIRYGVARGELDSDGNPI